MPRKESSSNSGTKRPRASMPKVKTGCLTCKIRHLKCDETKPHCNRCTSTGRTCDGYPPPFRPTILAPPPPSLALTTLPGTPSERYSFHTFHTRTAPQLRGLFASPFWSQHVLQACLKEEAVWHAAVALGSVHAGICGATVGEEFAVRQYVKAIECLVRPGVERRVDVTLIACILFTCFESLRGHHAPALLHLDNGVNLLLELQSRQLPPSPTNPSSTHPHPTYPRTPYTPFPTLQAILTRLDTQATQLLPLRRTRLKPQNVPCTNYSFASLEDAQRASDELWNYCLYTLQPAPEEFVVPSQDYTAEQLQSAHPPRPPVRVHLAHWQSRYTTALSAYLTAHPAQTAREKLASDTLRLHALVGTLSLSPPSLADTEEVWGVYTPQFAEIVGVAKEILDTESAAVAVGDDAEGGGKVGLDSGVLGPLYLVALRCRDKDVRRESVELLAKAGGRREGLWDSRLLAQIAAGVVRKEGGVGGEGGQGGGEKVADVDLVFAEGCRAGVKFVMEEEVEAGGGGRR